MLKITVSNEHPGITFTLSGRLVGPWVQELRQCWTRAEFDDPTHCQIDLREVTFIDEAGRTLLSQMDREGVRIHAKGCMTKAIVQDLSKIRAGDHGGGG
ncbi:MAG: hypothetical protein LZF60_270031 [Nitrospira sp.]|nr:MAG: hypothetical protein LZF60_270031 [Nitrospira sp.]